MKPGSFVVELLPYIPEGIAVGDWAKLTTKPTPLGVIFDETNLQHIGVPLQRDSAPYCYDDEKDDLKCWRMGHNPWDERDFLFPDDKVEMIIRPFLLGELETCEDYTAQARDKYVLYNVNCKGEGEEKVTPHHFYWKG